MKTVSKSFRLIASAATVTSMVFMPLSGTALAVEAKTSPFCTNLSTRVSSITSQVNNLSGKVAPAWAQQDEKLSSADQKVDQDVAAARQKADSDRDANFTKLEAKATTDAQKQAVQTYETAVKTAVTTRRGAYDAARQTFRTGVKDAVLARRSTVAAQISQFKASVNAAVASAQASCTSNPASGASVRTTLVSALKTARQTFQSNRKGDETVGSQVKQLAATRNDSFKAADQAFKASMVTARDALRQAFGSSNTSV